MILYGIKVEVLEDVPLGCQDFTFSYVAKKGQIFWGWKETGFLFFPTERVKKAKTTFYEDETVAMEICKDYSQYPVETTIIPLGIPDPSQYGDSKDGTR